MTKHSIIIELDEEAMKALEKRAEKCLLSPRELASDIIRRSMISYRKGKSTLASLGSEDALIRIFSRDPRGRRRAISNATRKKKKR
jgi:hypothetical protein